MKIKINDQARIGAIQKEFNNAYPYLSLEFYAKSNRKGGPASRRKVKSDNIKIGQCRTTHNNGEITISPQMTVAELESHFADVFDLHVQILRKSGSLWMQTPLTEKWTLEEQNRQGEILRNVMDDASKGGHTYMSA